MTTPSWAEVSALFHRALDQPADAREAFVRTHTAHDPALGDRVRVLLAEHEAPDDFLETPAVALTPDDLPEPLPGNGRIGPYRLLRELGRGGMGAVYLAARNDGEYDQQVALKLVKRGMDTDRIVARFRQERQLLAALDHPNIARLLDGGTTDDGRPYVVMEYVDGVSIREYCAQQSLSVETRLALFRTLCGAVQHAHQALIVHRDIKAANVLVTRAGVPKLLDFGIARLLDATPSDGATATETLHALTPEYASPEQLAGAPLSTGTDVYSLGVLLYELLAGQRPFATAGHSLPEIMRLVRETDPPPPSTVVVTQDPALARRLRGDLDTIVLMAMRKEPVRRYQSVEQLSEDVRRHLERLPVTAQRDRVGYRITKFVRRNTVAVAAGALAVLALTGGLAASLWQARIARAERTRAERRFAEVRTLATSFLFDINDAIVELPGSTPTRALLVRRALESLDGLAKEAPGDPSLQRDLAAAYVRIGSLQGNSANANLGDTPGALASYQKAVSLIEEIPQPQRDAASVRDMQWQAYEGLANMQIIVGDLKNAVASLERARDVLRGLVSADSANIGRTRMLAVVLREIGDVRAGISQSNIGDIPGALREYRASVALHERLRQRAPGDISIGPSLASSLMSLGSLEQSIGDTLGTTRLTRAITLLQQATVDAPQNAYIRRELLGAYSRIRQPWADAGRFADAIAIDRKTIALLDEMIAVDTLNMQLRRDRGVMLNSLGRDLRAAGQPAAAVPYHRAALAVAEQRSAADPKSLENQHDVAIAQLFLGEALSDAGQSRTALDALERARVTSTALLSNEPDNPRHPEDLGLIHALRGRVQHALGNTAGADAAFAQALPPAELAARDSLNQWAQMSLGFVYATIADVVRDRQRTSGAPCAPAGTWYAKSEAAYRRADRNGALPQRLRPAMLAAASGAAACGGR